MAAFIFQPILECKGNCPALSTSCLAFTFPIRQLLPALAHPVGLGMGPCSQDGLSLGLCRAWLEGLCINASESDWLS